MSKPKKKKDAAEVKKKVIKPRVVKEAPKVEIKQARLVAEDLAKLPYDREKYESVDE